MLGFENFAKIEAGVKETLINCDFITKIRRNSDGTYEKESINIEAQAGIVEAYAEAIVCLWLLFFESCSTLYSETYEIWKGWPVVKLTW